MGWRKTTYRREDLYREVWAEPVVQVAKRYGISNVALAAICRELHVPIPPRGYWVEKASGKAAKAPPLPAAAADTPKEVTREHWHRDVLPPVASSTEVSGTLMRSRKKVCRYECRRCSTSHTSTFLLPKKP